MCVCAYEYVCCKCARVCVYLYMRMRLRMCMLVCVFAFVYVRVCMSVSSFEFVCACVYSYMCACCMCVCVHVHICVLYEGVCAFAPMCALLHASFCVWMFSTHASVHSKCASICVYFLYSQLILCAHISELFGHVHKHLSQLNLRHKNIKLQKNKTL